MKLDRAVKIKMEGKIRVGSIYSMGRSFKMQSYDIHKRYLEFKANLPKETPYWVRSYFDGLAECHTDYYYKYDLHFGYWIDNVLYSTHKDNPMYYKKHRIEPSELFDKLSGHYWIDGNQPYFENEEDK